MSGISHTSATITGTVNTHGLQTEYGFEIGTEPGNYGPATGLGSLGGALTEEVHVTLSGLQPGTTYYYRLTATNVDGTTDGAEGTFTTTGLADLLTVPGALPLIGRPAIAFPKEEPGTSTRTKTLTNAQKLSKALRACRRDRKHGKRIECEKAGRHKYGAVRKRTGA